MSWLPIVLWLLRVLRGVDIADLPPFVRDLLESLLRSKFGKAFAQFDGELLKFIWENREEILDFILRIMDLFNETGGPPVGVPTVKVLSEEQVAKTEAAISDLVNA